MRNDIVKVVSCCIPSSLAQRADRTITSVKPVEVASLLFVLLLLSGCGAPDPSLDQVERAGDGPAGEILFVAGGDVHRWSGGSVEQVTSDVHAMSPRWSPDGDRFAYVEMFAELGYSELMIADRDGDVLGQITDHRPDAEPFSEDFVRYSYWALDPVWSPVYEQLAWVSDLGGWEAPDHVDRHADPLYLWFSETWDAPPYLLPASQELPVTALIGDGDVVAVTQESPTFSPDGQQLAFVARAYPNEIWLLDLNAGDLNRLVQSTNGAYDPAWSPDGDHIAYVQRDGAVNNVWIAPVDGGDPYRLTSISNVVSPVWSPDGNHLAFFHLVGDQFEAWHVEVTSTSTGRLTATEPKKLFESDDIDAPSGMSWRAATR